MASISERFGCQICLPSHADDTADAVLSLNTTNYHKIV